jgi:type I restriction enzyme, S subunit
MSVATWPKVRSRFLFRRRDIRGSDAPLASATKDGVLLRDDLDISVWNPESDISNYKLVEPGDFVIGLRSFQHGISHSEIRGIVSPAYTVLRGTHEADPRFFKYYFRSKILISQLANITQGIRQGQTIDIEAFANLELAVPSLSEQRRIADFLDAETARIDQLSALQTTVLEKLNQRDRAVRDSLADTLVGQVGELPLRRFASKIEQGSSPSCENHPREPDRWGVLKLSAVKGGRFYPEENKQLPDNIEPSREYEVHDGDLLVSRANTPELVGDVAVASNAGRGLLLPDLIYRVGLGRHIEADFAAQIFLSTRVRSLIQATARGSSQSMVKLRGEDIRGWPVPRASVRQQRALVSAVTEQLNSSARLRAAVERQLELLAERRQSLITAAVTGGIAE